MTNAEIIAKLQNAKGPDRELDLEIGKMLCGWCMKPVNPHGELLWVPEDETYYSPNPGGMYPALTESLDAIVALVERKYPEWDSRKGSENYKAPFCLGLGLLLFYAQTQSPDSTPTIALCIALMKSMEDKG